MSGLTVKVLSTESMVDGPVAANFAGESKPPQWNHLVAVIHHMRPGVVFAVPLPPLSWWLNEHPHCLHVWEVKDDNLVKCWKLDGRGDKPT